MYKPHRECIPPQPIDSLWRYMTLTKLLDLLETGELYFTQLKRMEDPYEGALSDYSVEALRRQLVQLGDTDSDMADKSAQEIYRLNQYFTYVNCWHQSSYESMAMWKQYGEDGIAIRTTFARFRASLGREEKDIHIGQVQYGDYPSTLMNFGNTISPVFFKRRVFDFEKEVRAACILLPTESGPTMQDLLSLDEAQPAGVRVRVEVQTLIERIYVSPGKPSWYRELIAKLLRRYDYDLDLENSSINERPSFR